MLELWVVSMRVTNPSLLYNQTERVKLHNNFYRLVLLCNPFSSDKKLYQFISKIHNYVKHCIGLLIALTPFLPCCSGW